MHRFGIRVIAIMLVGGSLFISGCSPQPWFDKYGDRIEVSLDKKVTLLRQVNSVEELEASSGTLTSLSDQYEELTSAMNKDSWDNKIELTQEDKDQIGKRAARIDKLLEDYYAEVERILEIRFRLGPSRVEAVGALMRIHGNPFDPKKNSQYYQPILMQRFEELRDEFSPPPSLN